MKAPTKQYQNFCSPKKKEMQNELTRLTYQTNHALSPLLPQFPLMEDLRRRGLEVCYNDRLPSTKAALSTLGLPSVTLCFIPSYNAFKAGIDYLSSPCTKNNTVRPLLTVCLIDSVSSNALFVRSF